MVGLVAFDHPTLWLQSKFSGLSMEVSSGLCLSWKEGHTPRKGSSRGEGRSVLARQRKADPEAVGGADRPLMDSGQPVCGTCSSMCVHGPLGRAHAVLCHTSLSKPL